MSGWTVDRLIAELTNLNIDHQEVRVCLPGPEGEPLPINDLYFTHGGLSLVLVSVKGWDEA